MQLRAMLLLAGLAACTAAPLAAQKTDSMTALPAQQIGGKRAGVVIEEYSDFQCPYCAAHEMKFAAAVEQWVLAQKGNVRFDFYDVALPQHANAGTAARAARCAGEQGHYGEARHALFADQAQWASAPDGAARATALARAVVRDSARFATCMEQNLVRTSRRLEANLQRARDLGVPGTPTFLIVAGEHVAQIVDPASPDSLAAVVRSLQK